MWIEVLVQYFRGLLAEVSPLPPTSSMQSRLSDSAKLLSQHMHPMNECSGFTFLEGKGKVDHAPQESIGRCSSPSSRPRARRWRTNNVCVARPDLWLPSQPQGITAHWLVPIYTAWWQRHLCVNNLPRVALDSGEAGTRTHDLLIVSPAPYHYATETHIF